MDQMVKKVARVKKKGPFVEDSKVKHMEAAEIRVPIEKLANYGTIYPGNFCSDDQMDEFFWMRRYVPYFWHRQRWRIIHFWAFKRMLEPVGVRLWSREFPEKEKIWKRQGVKEFSAYMNRWYAFRNRKIWAKGAMIRSGRKKYEMDQGGWV